MALLGMMLAVEEATGSLGTGSQVVGVMTITAGLLGPAAGRWFDQHEIRSALQVRCTTLAVSLLVMAALVEVNAPTWAFYLLSFVCGISLAGVWGGFRALLVVVLEPTQRRHAHFVESLMIEVTYGTGPLLIGLIVGLFNAVAGLVTMAAFSFAATLSLLSIEKHHPVSMLRAHAPWRNGPFATIYVFGFFLGMAFGSIESNVAARMEGFGLESSSAGLFLALLATSSVIGGVWVSVRPMRSSDPMRTAAAMFVGFAVLVLPSVAAPNRWIFGATLLIASVFLVPLNGLGAAEVETRTSHGQRAEAFAYLMAATQMGSGLGVLLNGVLSERIAPRTVPLLASGLLLMLGAVMTVLRSLVSVTHRSRSDEPGDVIAAVAVTAGGAAHPPRTSTDSGAS